MRLPTRFLAVSLLAACLPACGSGGPAGPGQCRPLTYAALGASDAVGTGAVLPVFGYVYLLNERLAQSECAVELHNFGILGAKADDIASWELPGAILADPQVATLWTGANDLIDGRSPDVFERQIDAILAGLRNRTRSQVFVGDLPDLTRAPRFVQDPDPDVTAERLAAFNARIHAAVAARGCVLVPLSALPIDPSLFAGDGFHPNGLGHRRIADAFWEQIQPRI